MQKDNARDIIAGLVARFAEQIDSYKHSDYNETQTRRDFIDPFFKALGWDIDNQNVPEENIQIVQKLYEAFGKRDINAIIEMLSTEVEWGEPSNPFNPAGGTRFGHEGFL